MLAVAAAHRAGERVERVRWLAHRGLGSVFGAFRQVGSVVDPGERLTPSTPPSATNALYDTAPAPKYLLELLGASHLPPYSSVEPQLGVVERVTVAFLNHYLKRIPGSLKRLLADGSVPGVATLKADP